MLPRSHRLPSSVRLVGARTIQTPYCLIKYAPSQLPHPRVSVVISKKVDKRAVKRNQIRRAVIAGITPFMNKMRQPQDLLFIMRQQAGADAVLPDAIASGITEALRKEGLI